MILLCFFHFHDKDEQQKHSEYFIAYSKVDHVNLKLLKKIQKVKRAL